MDCFAIRLETVAADFKRDHSGKIRDAEDSRGDRIYLGLKKSPSDTYITRASYDQITSNC